jgi:hypothetical protein
MVNYNLALQNCASSRNRSHPHHVRLWLAARIHVIRISNNDGGLNAIPTQVAARENIEFEGAVLRIEMKSDYTGRKKRERIEAAANGQVFIISAQVAV